MIDVYSTFLCVCAKTAIFIHIYLSQYINQFSFKQSHDCSIKLISMLSCYPNGYWRTLKYFGGLSAHYLKQSIENSKWMNEQTDVIFLLFARKSIFFHTTSNLYQSLNFITLFLEIVLFLFDVRFDIRRNVV